MLWKYCTQFSFHFTQLFRNHINNKVHTMLHHSNVLCHSRRSMKYVVLNMGIEEICNNGTITVVRIWLMKMTIHNAPVHFPRCLCLKSFHDQHEMISVLSHDSALVRRGFIPLAQVVQVVLEEMWPNIPFIYSFTFFASC